MTSLGHPYDALPQYRCEKLREIGEQGKRIDKKLTDKQRKEMLKKRYGDVKEKPEGRKSTEKELMNNEQAWERD